MTPLAQAVRFIHGKQSNINLTESLHKRLRSEPLRCNINKLIFSRFHPLNPLSLFRPAQSRVDHRCCYPLVMKRVHLVFHQRDEWRDD